MGQNSSTSAFQNSSQPFFQRHRSSTLDLRPNGDEGSKSFSHAAQENPSRGVQEVANAGKQVNSISQEPDSDYANRSHNGRVSELLSEKIAFTAGSVKEASSNKENSLPAPSSLISSADTSFSNGKKSEDGKRQEYFQNAIKADHISRSVSEHSLLATAEDHPAQESNLFRSQSMERTFSQPKKSTKHKRQTSAVSRMSLQNNVILEDSREHLYNPARDEPFSSYQPTSASLPLKSSFDIDYALNLTYAQLAEYRRNIRTNDLMARKGQKWEELGAEISASNTLPKSPFERQNLGGKSGTSSVSTNSSDTGVSRSKKKRAPAPPVPSTRPHSFAGNPSRDSVTSGHSFGFLHNTGKSVQRTVSSVSRSSKPPAPQPLPTSYSFMSLDKSVPGVRNPRALGKSSRPTSAILPRWDQEKVSVATSAELFSSLYNKESLNESIDQAKKQLEAMKKLQEKLKSEKFTEKGTSEKDTKNLATDTVAKDNKIDTESGRKDNDKSVDKDNVVGTVKKDALTDTAFKKEADQIQSTVNSLSVSTNAADISFLSAMDERQPPERLASPVMAVPTVLENMDKTDPTQRNLVSEECKSSFQVFPEVDTSVVSLKKEKANKDLDIVQDGHERERHFAKVITTHGTESVDVHLFSTYPENTNTEASTYPDNTSTEASTYPDNTSTEASTYPENTSTEASTYPDNVNTEASTYPDNTNTEASTYPDNTSTEASTYPDNTSTEASAYPENTKTEARTYPENTKTEASTYPENTNTEASIYPENTNSACPLNTNIEAAESSAPSWKPDDKSQTPENDHQMEDRASTVSRDFSKRSSIQSEDMSISSSNTSQRVFSPDWAPEHDLDSDDDIMDEKYSERFSSQGFKSSTIPRKLRGFGEKKKEKKKKKKSQRPHESKEEEKKKFGSIRRFKNSVHESMRTAIGSISKASGKLLKKQQYGRVLDATESSFPDSDIPKVSEYSRWGLSASCNGSVGHAESDDYTDYPFRNGEYDPGLSASSDDNIGDIDFAYGIDEIPVVRRESRHTIQDSQDKRNVKLPGVAYVAQKGQIIILPEYQTVQQDGHGRLGKKGEQNDGHAPKIRGQKTKKYTYESTVRESEKHRMNELLAKEIFEKERQIDTERQRQREMEMEIQRLRKAEAQEQRNLTQRRNMQEQINLLQQSQLQSEQINLLQQSQLQLEHRELNSKALSTNHLNLVSVTPALQTSSVGYDTDKPWSNLSDIGASPPSSLYFNNSVYMGQPVLLGPYQSMPVLPTVVQGQHSMNRHSSAALVNGAPITHCLSSIDIAYLSEYMRMIGVSPPTNSLEWNVLLSSCSVTPPSIPGSDRAHGQATASGVRYGPDLSQIFESKTMQEKDTEESTVFTNQQLTLPTDASPLQEDKGAVIYVPSKLEDLQTDIYSQTVNQPQSLHITPDANTAPSATTEPPPTAAPFTTSKPTEDTHNTDILTAHSQRYKEQPSRPNQDGPRYNDVGAEKVQIVTNNEFITTQTPPHRPRVLPASVYGPIGFRPVSFRGSHS